MKHTLTALTALAVFALSALAQNPCQAPDQAWQTLFAFPATEQEAQTLWVVNYDDLNSVFRRLVAARRVHPEVVVTILNSPKLKSALGKAVESALVEFNPCTGQGNIEFSAHQPGASSIDPARVAELGMQIAARGPGGGQAMAQPASTGGPDASISQGPSAGTAVASSALTGLSFVNPYAVVALPAVHLLGRGLDSLFTLSGVKKRRDGSAFNMDRKNWWKDF